jgi:hypothetical protein
MSSLVDMDPYLTRASYRRVVGSEPRTQPDAAHAQTSVNEPSKRLRSNFSDAVVIVTARDLGKNAVFKPIQDAIIRLAQQAISRLHNHQEGDANDDQCLSTFLEYNSDDETDSKDNSQDEKEVNDEQTARIFSPDIVLDGYIFAPREFDILTERLPSSFGDYTLKYEMFDGQLAVHTVPSHVHGKAVGIFNYTVNSWADDPANRGSTGCPLESLTDTSMSHWSSG